MGSTDDYRIHAIFHKNKILIPAPAGPGSPVDPYSHCEPLNP